MKHLLSLCVLCLLVCAGLAACTGVTSSPNSPTSASTSVGSPVAPRLQVTPTSAASALSLELNVVVNGYYSAVEAGNYSAAYAYLDPKATDITNGETLTRSNFIQLAQSMDSEEGPVVSYAIGVFPPSTSVTMTVTRKHLGPYHAQLDMKQENGIWKIVTLDRI